MTNSTSPSVFFDGDFFLRFPLLSSTTFEYESDSGSYEEKAKGPG
eukprot:CAMPEP_0185819144 /NCGR_PEP_ID=MMETSP1322-20130828/21766_1 /TAXON_ID=265543 /ORGANISM="Minutocellus polymorphus, Strain RCC2270" /LENGTH=44 /DNA_ID= /DNA_START= /DNA_END= /DNA_ORIENTATION=